MNDTKKAYVQPSVELLGSVAEKTQAGALFPSDDGRTRDSAQPFS